MIELPGLGAALRRRGSRGSPGLALDLGSARTRAWIPSLGLVADAPTIACPPDVLGYPVRRGSIADAAVAARLLARLLSRHVPPTQRPELVVMTLPVLSSDADRSAALAAVEILRPRAVLTIDTVRAAALGAKADLTEPLLVIDLGADLTEVGVLGNDSILEARRVPLGTSDFGSITADDLVDSTCAMVTDLLHQNCGPQVVDALDRGPLLTGGGALRPAITCRIAERLSCSIRTAFAPQTIAVRGACAALLAAGRHPGTVGRLTEPRDR
ncbi:MULTISPECIES: rod shape-determining protein [unclassified Kribbella]|uniref:rod shape-determining protein n=1 Tax=unclassified Kribbella TaxID=2644121 RepID=UPI0033FF249A